MSYPAITIDVTQYGYDECMGGLFSYWGEVVVTCDDRGVLLSTDDFRAAVLLWIAA